MSTVVTGGSGVVGGAVLARLVEAGREVKAMARSEGSVAVVRGLGAEPVQGDVLDYRSLLDAFQGADVVYHVAGLNQLCPRHPEQLFRVNVDGSRNVVRAAGAAGVRRLVYTSSTTVLGEPRGRVGDEGSRHRGSFLSHYERSKFEAEKVVFAEAGGLELVAVLPSSVQGPGRAGGTGKLILDLLNGKLPALVDTRLSIVDIDDCARGHLLAEERGRPGERYVLNGFTLSVRAAVGLLEEVVGRRVAVRYLPGRVAILAGALVEVGARLRRRRPSVCREMVRTLLHGHAYDGSKATRELGLEYTPAEETIRRLVLWARSEGLVGDHPEPS